MGSSYEVWCGSRGVSPFHPEDWSGGDVRAYVAWKAARCRALLRQLAASGMFASLDREARIRKVRDLVAEVAHPPVRRVTAACPCHPTRFVREPLPPEEVVTGEDIEAWRTADIFERLIVPRRAARERIGVERRHARAARWRARDTEGRAQARERVAEALGYLEETFARRAGVA